MNKFILTTAISVALTVGLVAKESKPIQMTTSSYQQIVVKDKKGKIKKDKHGKPIKKWVRATKVVPGTVVKYIDTVTNDTNETLKGAGISNPINEHLTFIAGSAKSKAKFGVKYSVDGGKSYDVPANLFVKDKKGKKIQAQPKHYNAILFEIDEVPAHSKVDVEFKVKLK